MINAEGKARMLASEESMKDFALMLSNQLGMPVDDQTGLSGKYDVTLSWSSGGVIGRRPDSDAASEPGITIEGAVQQQLGLKLVAKRGPVDTLVIDKVERNPTEN